MSKIYKKLILMGLWALSLYGMSNVTLGEETYNSRTGDYTYNEGEGRQDIWWKVQSSNTLDAISSGEFSATSGGSNAIWKNVYLGGPTPVMRAPAFSSEGTGWRFKFNYNNKSWEKISGACGVVVANVGSSETNPIIFEIVDTRADTLQLRILWPHGSYRDPCLERIYSTGDVDMSQVKHPNSLQAQGRM